MPLSYNIQFENEQFIVINKPSGLLSIPDRNQSEWSLKDMLLQRFGSIYTVHRLDKDTSGLIIFAKNEASHQYLSKVFEERKVKKDYQGLVKGLPHPLEDTINAPIKEHPTHKGTMFVHREGKPAVTDYKVLHTYGKLSLMAFSIHTGRTHQIRVHCKHIGHPILCDPIYGDGKGVLLSSIKRHYKLGKNESSERPILNRLALHASELSFLSQTGESYHFTAPLSKDMQALIRQLDKNQ